MEQTRVCNECGEEKPLETGFYPIKDKVRGTVHWQRSCRKCRNKKQVARRVERLGREAFLERQQVYNRRRTKEQRLNGQLRSRYGIDLVTYRAMEEAQDHRCKICLRVLSELRVGNRSGTSVDHCHTTGKVRGLLCHDCNRGLGDFKDSPKILQAAIEYLEGNR